MDAFSILTKYFPKAIAEVAVLCNPNKPNDACHLTVRSYDAKAKCWTATDGKRAVYKVTMDEVVGYECHQKYKKAANAQLISVWKKACPVCTG